MSVTPQDMEGSEGITLDYPPFGVVFCPAPISRQIPLPPATQSLLVATHLHPPWARPPVHTCAQQVLPSTLRNLEEPVICWG